MRKLITCLLCGWCAGLLCAAATLEKASVTMPYAELASLLDRVAEVERSVAKAPALSPVPVVVNLAEYDLDLLQPERPALNARFLISNLSNVWQAVPILEHLVVVTSVEPSDAKLVVKDGWLCALLPANSELALDLGLMVDEASASRGKQTVAALSLVGASRSILKVQHTFDPSVLSVTGAVASNPEKTQFGLSAAGGLISVNVYDAEALAPTQWRGEMTSVVRSDAGRLLLNSRIRLSATDNGRTTGAALKLPAMVDLQSLESPGMVEPYRMEMTDAGPVIFVAWQADTAMHRELTLEYTMPMTGASASLKIPRVHVAGAIDWNSTYYVLPFEGFSIEPQGAAWLTATHLPPWVSSLAGASDVFRHLDTSGEGLEIVTKALPRLKTADATITSARYFTDVVAGGGMLHRGDIEIQHLAATRYTFSLPEQSKLLTCHVNGRSTEPLLLESGALSLIVPAAKGGATNVSYVFTTKGSELDPVEGAAQLELPRTPLFINEIKWLVQLPAVYQATAIEGNVVIDSSGEHNGPVRLSKQICDDEAPYARLYYTRKDLNL
jgi:hypothetical protein